MGRGDTGLAVLLACGFAFTFATGGCGASHEQHSQALASPSRCTVWLANHGPRVRAVVSGAEAIVTGGFSNSRPFVLDRQGAISFGGRRLGRIHDGEAEVYNGVTVRFDRDGTLRAYGRLAEYEFTPAQACTRTDSLLGAVAVLVVILEGQ